MIWSTKGFKERKSKKYYKQQKRSENEKNGRGEVGSWSWI